jgi:arsenite-transporting ATPase
MRIIFCAGKGGVGKTSISAATGLTAAQRGAKTLVMSLDPAHSLSDSFDLDKELMDRNKGIPLQIDDNLWIQEVDIQFEIERNWKEIYYYINLIFNVTGLDNVISEELAIIPGMEELSSLLYINQYVRNNEFDAVILDCAPTGESIRFLSIPTGLDWYMRKIFKIDRQLTKIARPLAKTIYSLPLPEDNYFDAVKSLYEKLQGIEHIITDPQITTVRLVTNPEKIVIKETQRAYMYFSLFGLTLDGIVVNRILPEGLTGEYLQNWRKIHDSYVESIREIFNPLPLFHVPLFSQEVLGKKDLFKLGQILYGESDPLSIFYHDKVYTIEKN